MKKVLYLPLFLLASSAALADDAAVLKCRTLPDTAQRLACYDAMPVGATPPASAAMNVTPASAAPAPATPASAPAPAAAPVPARTAEQSFGLEQVRKKEQTDAIESTVVGDFEGWEGNTTIKLANGQVWRIADGSSAFLGKLSNPAVRIERGAFGAIYLQVVGQNKTARVRRVQ